MRNGKEEEIAAESVRVGETIIVRLRRGSNAGGHTLSAIVTGTAARGIDWRYSRYAIARRLRAAVLALLRSPHRRRCAAYADPRHEHGQEHE